MTKHGFKEIDSDNWLEPDPIMKGFVRFDPVSGSIHMEGPDWVNALLEPGLSETVPDDVQALFEVARGAMVYGFFFYPLYTLSSEQLYRVAETAVKQKCIQLRETEGIRSFARRIKWLHAVGVIPDSDLIRWEAIRNLRNVASHPDKQSIITPGNAIGTLERLSELINSLFAGA